MTELRRKPQKFKRHFRNENSGRRNMNRMNTRDNTLSKVENREEGFFNSKRNEEKKRFKKKTEE